MTVTWEFPVTGQPFGPGFFFKVTSDFIGPLPTGSRWEIQLVPTADETALIAVTQTVTTTPEITGWLGKGLSDQLVVNPAWPFGVQGASGLATATLVNNLAIPLDSGTVAVEIDMTSGLPWLIQRTAAGSGGLTVEQAVQLEETHSATLAKFPGGLDIPIGDFIQRPPSGVLRRVAIEPDRTGSGNLVPPGSGLTTAYGIAWDILDYPAGIGLNDGAPGTYDIEMVQLAARHTLADGTIFFSDWITSRVGNTHWWPAEGRPTRIEYWIAPGVSVRFFWLQIIEL